MTRQKFKKGSVIAMQPREPPSRQQPTTQITDLTPNNALKKAYYDPLPIPPKKPFVRNKRRDSGLNELENQLIWR